MPLPLLPLAGLALTAPAGAAGLMLYRRMRPAAPAPSAEVDEEHEARCRQLASARSHLRSRLTQLGLLRRKALSEAVHRFVTLQDRLRNLPPGDPTLQLSLHGLLGAADRSPELLSLWAASPIPDAAQATTRWLVNPGEAPEDEDATLLGEVGAADPRGLARAVRAMSRDAAAREAQLTLLLPRAMVALQKLARVTELETDVDLFSRFILPGEVISARDLVTLNRRYAAALAALLAEPMLTPSGTPRPAASQDISQEALRLDGWQ